MLPGTGSDYMLDQVRKTTCSRKQYTAGGRGGVRLYVRMNISYDQSLRGFAESNFCSGLGPACGTDSGHIIEQSLHSKT